MAQVMLWCAVYCEAWGHAVTFPVVVAHDAKVRDLQEAIFTKKRYYFRYHFDASALTLYVARKDGAWPKDGHSIRGLFLGEIDTQYERMCPMAALSKPEYFGDFEFGDEEIHVLVELPNRKHWRVDPQVLDIYRTVMNPYVPKVLTSKQRLEFKAKLCTAYGSDADTEKLRCMLLGVPLPSQLVVACHLFRYNNASWMKKLMGFSDVDDTRNGLLLVEPLRDAFDRFQLSFVFDKTRDEFHMKLLDASLQDKPLLEEKHCTALLQGHGLPKNWELQGSRCVPGTSYDVRTTFGDLEGHALSFGTLLQPYKHCLDFHARLARAKAVEKKWIKPSDGRFEEFRLDGIAR